MMNTNIKRLLNITEKDSRHIIGLMSGTSLDGLDVALCEIKGSGLDTKLDLKKFITIGYDADLKKEIKGFTATLLDEDKLRLASDTSKASRENRWAKNIAKDIYVYEASNVLNDLK